MSEEWQPVKLAPQDLYDDVLVFCADTREMFVAYRSGGYWCYALDRNGEEIVCHPSHWRDLPPHPTVCEQR